MSAKPKPNELQLTRIYKAPVKLVWEAYTDPKHAAHWWGPRGFTITTHSKDLRPGGKWIYTMHGPDGVDYENRTTYHIVEPYSRLVYDHGGNAQQEKLFTVDVTFTEINGQTKMVMTMGLPTAEAAQQTKKFIKQVGGNSTWDRLAEYLDQSQFDEKSFVINRSFETSVEKLFEMWTQPEHLKRWLPPSGYQMEFISANIQTGGSLHFKMFNNESTQYVKFEYLEVSAGQKIIYKQHFLDINGNLVRHTDQWPAEMTTAAVFDQDVSGEARVTVKSTVSGHYTESELKAFINEKTGMAQGWGGSFDELEKILV